LGSFSILNNIAAVNGQYRLNIINFHLSRTLNRLSSGKRINSGADDAAGLQIADSLRGNVYALNQAVRNANDGIAFLQIADGALEQMTNMLIRAVTLAEEAASEPIGADGRKSLDAEFQQIQAEIARIASQTNYNGMNLFIYDAVSANYADLKKQLDSATDPNQIIDIQAKMDAILAAVNATETELLNRAKSNRDFGETLDVFVGDLSAASYINVNLGSIVVGTPIYETVKVEKPVTVPVSEMIMSTVRASEANPPVDANGRFQFYATNEHGDPSQGLLYYLLGSPYTSAPAVRVGTTIYNLWDLQAQPTEYSNGAWSTTYKLTATGGVDLTIIQKVSVVNNPSDIGGQSYKIDYEVINNNPGAPVAFDLMFHADTQLGTNDAPLVVDGENVTTNKSYPRDEPIPDMVEIFNPAKDPLINGVIRFAPGSEPDRLNLGQYNIVRTFGNLPTGSATNYGYAVIWENRTAGATPVVLTTYYGVKTPDLDALAASLGDKLIGDQYVIGTESVMESVIVGYEYDSSKAADKVISFGGNDGLADTNLLTADGAAKALSDIKAALNEISKMRGSIGAGMNRLQAAISVLQTQSRNTLAAESSIRDANMAEEISNLAKFQILSQTGIAALAQANSNSQLVLSLLR
jgi:flagellin-like hook-associated protein FlgL